MRTGPGMKRIAFASALLLCPKRLSMRRPMSSNLAGIRDIRSARPEAAVGSTMNRCGSARSRMRGAIPGLYGGKPNVLQHADPALRIPTRIVLTMPCNVRCSRKVRTRSFPFSVAGTTHRKVPARAGRSGRAGHLGDDRVLGTRVSRLLLKPRMVFCSFEGV